MIAPTNNNNYGNDPYAHYYGGDGHQHQQQNQHTAPHPHPPGSYNPYNNQQQQKPNNEGVRFRRDYLLSVSGIIRLLIILMLCGGWISAAGARKNAIFDLIGDYGASRLAYIIIAVIATGISIVIFVFFILNISNIGYFTKCNFPFITLLLDALFFFPMIALGIVAAVREADYSKRPDAKLGVNQGAFAAASVFAFFSAVLYAGSCALEVIATIRRRQAKYPNAPK